MSIKKIFALLMFAIAGIFYYAFILPFKALAVDNVSSELVKLEAAYTQATQQLSLKALRIKKEQLGERELLFLKSFIPQNLKAGHFVYNLGQMANQNGLNLKSLQYTIISTGDVITNAPKEKKLMVEFTMEGKYENFANWLRLVETSDVLMDVESFRGTKNSNTQDVVTFYVKLYAYGQDID